MQGKCSERESAAETPCMFCVGIAHGEEWRRDYTTTNESREMVEAAHEVHAMPAKLCHSYRMSNSLGRHRGSIQQDRA